MQPDDPQSMRDQVGRYWDELARGAAAPDHIDPTLAETIRRLDALDDAPAPAPGLADEIWDGVLRRQGVAAPGPSLSPAANGRHPAGGLRWPRLRAGRSRGQGTFGLTAAGLVRALGIGVLAGMAAGMVVGGGGARAAMRVAAVMAGPTKQGFHTENGNPVGHITAGGTVELLVQGALFGILGGLVFAAVKAWLPWSGL